MSRDLTGTIPCTDADACPYRRATCERKGEHEAHDWRPRITGLSGGQPMHHCPGDS